MPKKKSLDRKSSRGMIYENEELRLKTININAEIERGQSDIKKLRRENEFLKREIWHLRDEYEKLDKLLKQKEEEGGGFSCSSSTCSSDSSESSLTDDTKEVETTQNLENVQKTTNMKNLHVEFDHLSVVPEEPSTENSDKSVNDRTSFPDVAATASVDDDEEDATAMLPPDQGYPDYPMTPHFFAPLPSTTRPLTPPQMHFYTFRNEPPPIANKCTDLIVKTDNRNFTSVCPHQYFNNYNGTRMGPDGLANGVNVETSCPRSSFSNGGNLEELLNDIQTISEDILKMSSPSLEASNPVPGHYPLEKSAFNGNFQKLNLSELEPQVPVGNHGEDNEKYKSEISVMLMPTPMPLIGFEKYQNLSIDSLKFPSGELSNSKSNLLGEPSGTTIPEGPTSENGPIVSYESNDPPEPIYSTINKEKKMSIRRKVSIHFKGRKQKDKDKEKSSEDLLDPDTTPSTSSGKKPSTPPLLRLPIPNQNPNRASDSSNQELDLSNNTQNHITPAPSPILNNSHSGVNPTSSSGHQSSDSERQTSTKHHNKSTSASPERNDPTTKKHHKHKKHKTKNAMTSYLRQRRNTLSTDRLHRERSFSICTDRSNLGERGHYLSDEYPPHSDRERTNSLSSCGTNAGNRRKFSNLSQFPGSSGGKIPWCACWGNGCI